MLRSIIGPRNVNPSAELVTVLPTMEVRWFMEGDIPSDVRTWFDGLSAKVDSRAARVDHYLSEPRSDAMGIKHRQGCLEVKQLQGERRLALLAPGWEGYVEKWRKWIFPLASGQRRRETLAALDSWIAVRKKRKVIDYGISSIGQPIALRRGANVTRSCSVELTEVRVHRDMYWTLGLEAASSDLEEAEHALRRVAREVLDGYPLSPFGSMDSRGYPSWLQMLNVRAGA